MEGLRPAPVIPGMLERNLTALAVGSPRAAEAVRAAAPRPGLTLGVAEDGGLTGELDGRRLASFRRPRDEGAALAKTFDPMAAGGAVILGWGAGHHVRSVAERMSAAGVVMVFEPDGGLLRAVMEREDLTPLFSRGNVAILTDPDDATALSAMTHGVEGVLALGVKIIEHPASRARLGELSARFCDVLATVIRAVRLSVVTTLVQIETTLRNILMNADDYLASPGVADLAGAARAKPAVVVSAGPSLRRNMHLLARPGVRDRVVIIAVQTVLKTLLAAGIKPHFVTALDYHEISRRFYEGLTPDMVRGVALVAEAKANPAIIGSFPGLVRCPGDDVLDGLLGPALAKPMGKVASGATVAHLAYGLARHLGCDPVILVGQDLGFTDGQYYAAGAAIHDVWASELSEFNSLEFMEWQRIARFGRLLHRTSDVLGRPIFTDEQMASYLRGFERMFADDEARGLTTLDATEGGVAKSHTRAVTLEVALRDHAAGDPIRLPPAEGKPALDAKASLALREKIRHARRDAAAIAESSRRARGLLERMLERHHDQREVNRLIDGVYELRDSVQELKPAITLVHFLNQTGTFKRFRADRALSLEKDLSKLERQKRQIGRDVTNVRWLADAADQVGSMLEQTLACLDGEPKLTRDPAPPEEEGSAPAAAKRVGAVVLADSVRTALGPRRDAKIAGRWELEWTIRRLRHARSLDAIVVLTDDPAWAIARLGAESDGVRVIARQPSWRPRLEAVAHARLWSRSCWRGGIGAQSVYDEVCPPRALTIVVEELALDAAVVLGAEWCLIDPNLVDAVVARYRERPASQRFTFTQAAPGLAPACIDATLLKELAEGEGNGPIVSPGGLLGYVPVLPQQDPIGKPACVHVPPALRDAHTRLIADSPASCSLIEAVMDRLGHDVLDAEKSTAAATAFLGSAWPSAPEIVHLELVSPAGAKMPAPLAEKVLAEIDFASRPIAVSLGHDATSHPAWGMLAGRARAAGAAGVHVRTALRRDPDVQALIDAAPEVISVDVLADTAASYREVTGSDDFAAVIARLDRLLGAFPIAGRGGLPARWVVPRLTRRDAVYEDVESFVIRWIMRAGACVVDPLPAPIPHERIEPLPTPAGLIQREARTVLIIGADGSARAGLGPAAAPLGDASHTPLHQLWTRPRQTPARRAG